MDDQRRPSPTGSGPDRRASRAAAWLAAGLAVAVVLAPIDSRAADARSLLPQGAATSPRTAGTAWRTAVERSELKARPRPTPTPTPTPKPTPTLTAATSSTRYVSTAGSDSAAGSALSPWRTIQHAADVAPAGSTIIVRGGTYAPFSILRPGLTVVAASGETVTVSGGTYVVLVRGTSDVTVRGLVIRDAPDLWGSGVRVESSTRVLIEGNTIRDNHSFGVKVKDATNVTIRDNEITKNDTGIELSGAVSGARVTGNRIHHNDRMVTSSRGGNGIVVTKTTGAVSIVGNRLWGNRAPHLSGGGYDGGAFEVYAASDLRIADNIAWDNNNVMETGTDGSAPCARLTFVRNVAYGAGSVAGETTGLILRCASDSLFAHNTFDGLDHYAFYVAAGGSFAGSIAGLRIVDNVIYRGRAYSLTSGLPTSLVIDHDLVRPGGSAATYGRYVAYVAGRGNTDSLAEFVQWTGFDRHGLQAAPRFVDADGRDYHLTSTSPAIDAGIDVTGETWAGSGPDIGRFEYVP